MYHEEAEGVWILCYDAADADCHGAAEPVGEGKDAFECKFFTPILSLSSFVYSTYAFRPSSSLPWCFQSFSNVRFLFFLLTPSSDILSARSPPHYSSLIPSFSLSFPFHLFFISSLLPSCNLIVSLTFVFSQLRCQRGDYGLLTFPCCCRTHYSGAA